MPILELESESTILWGEITPGTANPAYLDPALTIVGFRVEGTLNQPAIDSTTAAYFQSRAGEGNLTPFIVGPNDTAFKVDTSSKFLESVECCIDLEKQVSVFQTPGWENADTCGEGPVVSAPHGAMYRLIVRNCGNTPLLDPVITDAVLGIDIPLSDLTPPITLLNPGDEVVLTGLDIAELAWMEDLCLVTESIENTARVDAVCADPAGSPVYSQDTACWNCEEEEIEECRVTGRREQGRPDDTLRAQAERGTGSQNLCEQGSRHLGRPGGSTAANRLQLDPPPQAEQQGHLRLPLERLLRHHLQRSRPVVLPVERPLSGPADRFLGQLAGSTTSTGSMRICRTVISASGCTSRTSASRGGAA